ncbi:histidine decarboxylase-like [Daphnia pulex]|uniref:histidine decarboxylase-like n=1 Tax=Daphnia pulex TaxID=6669 RepID=UPI001EDE4BDB|nr:histidine decarboxylase-like [Daphnia pulex]XP_046457977.1 histidine decarboxylase-like [Daphnia pulex]
MDFDEYRQRGKEMVDYIADYLQNIRQRRVFPDVKPGYIRHLLPEQAPELGEDWDTIFADVERVVMPGVTHWQSPYMHAYFPALNSFPSLLGDMLADAIGCLGFTWASSPACTELESLVMDWLGKMIGLPSEFLHARSDSLGGGVIQTTASESTFVALLAGRTEAIRRYKIQYPDLEDAEINSRLVGYCSDQAHSSVEKAGLIGLVKLRYIESDDELSMRGDTLATAIAQDREKGLIPFFVCATLGTTGACAFDHLREIGIVCRSEDIWLHVDAAYAGTAFLCPEFRHWLDGIEFADSIAFNPSKWMMVHFDCTAMWVKNAGALHRTFNVEPLYLKHENSGMAIDYMHWQIPLSKRFRALKLWFVIRSYGLNGLQKHVRHGVRLAKEFENMVKSDGRFEIPAARHLGMVVFRLKGPNDLTEALLKKINTSGKLHCVPAALKGNYVIRFTVTSSHTKLTDIERDWEIIKSIAAIVIDACHSHHATNMAGDDQLEENGHSSGQETGDDEAVAGVPRSKTNKMPLAETRKNKNFGTSLLLANRPMSPKIINGSFAAIFDNDDVLFDLARKISQFRYGDDDCPATQRRIRGMLMSGKQLSLDSRIDLVQRLVTDKDGSNPQIDESSECLATPSDIEEVPEEGSPCEEDERQRDRSHSVDSSRQLSLSNSCTGSGGGGCLKKKNVAFSERAGSIPEDGENVVNNPEREVSQTKI